jgi:hypothetical protein
VLPRHKAANWVGPGRGRKSTRPGANGVVELSPFAGRKPVRRSSQTSALAPTARGGRGHGWPCRRKASRGCSPRITSSGPPSRRSLSGTVASCAMPRLVGMRSADMRHAEMPPATAATHATNRDLTTPPDAKGETHGPGGGGVSARVPGVRRRHPADRVTPKPGPIRRVLTHLGEPPEPPPGSPARGPPTDWGELVQVHFRLGDFSGVTRRAARHRHPQPLKAFHATVQTAREKSGFKAGLHPREKPCLERG